MKKIIHVGPAAHYLRGTAFAPMMTRDNSADALDMTVRTFQLRAESIVDTDDERSVEAVIATEAPTMVLDMQRWEVVEEILLASGMRVAAADGQVPLLDTHDRSSVSSQLGSCRDIRAVGDEIIGRNFFSSVQAAVDCFTKIREKHVRDNSVGYQVVNFVTIEPGMTAEVAGRSFTAGPDKPLRVTTEWIIKENSVCPIGADAGAKMRKDAAGAAAGNKRTLNLNNNQREESAMNRAYLISIGMRADATAEETEQFVAALTDEQRAAAPVETQGTPLTVVPSGMTEQERGDFLAQIRADQTAIITAENARIASIRSEGAAAGVAQSVIDTCITDNSDISAARSAFITNMRAARPGVVGGPQISVPGNEISARHLACSLLQRGGAREDVLRNEFGEDIPQQSMERCRGISLMDMCRYSLSLAGHDVPVNRDDCIRAGFSTGSLPTILGDVAHKMLMTGYDAAVGTWEKWASVKEVSDFKDSNLVRLNVNGRLEKVANGGEVKTFERSEQKRVVSADTYAKNLAITRTDMINDDAGAFMDIAKKLGRKANQGVSDLVYTVLMANVLADGSSTALFSTTAHTDFDNKAIVNWQPGSALAITTLTSAIALFRKFREYNGDPIDVPPFAILCPPDLEGVANTLANSQLIVTGNTTNQAAQNPNAMHGLEVISESRLSNTRFTGYATNDFYIVPRAGDVDAVSVAFLNGVRTPQLSTFDCGPDRLGGGWQILFDYGVAATDIYMVKSEG